MRIISGLHKGKRLIAPKTLPVRPTTDFAKEGLFNILRHRFYYEDITVLDLFAGTGNISYEFASRGTQAITAVDIHAGCVRYIKKTADALELPIETVKSDVLKFLEKHEQQYDLVFADPPYAWTEEEFLEIPKKVFDGAILKSNGLLILEHSKHTDLSGAQHFSEARRYGGSVFSFFEQ
ncbi:RsmD family RNA methyltransferase [Flavobacteriaceae bacterium TK19130]|nr:RsmD family RNA methyltransferase [Thermobacterium salinum]